MKKESGPKALLVDADSQTLGVLAWALRELFPETDIVCSIKAKSAFYDWFVHDVGSLKVVVLPRHAADGCTLDLASRIRRHPDYKGVIFTSYTDPELLHILDPKKGDRTIEDRSELLKAVSVVLAHQHTIESSSVRPELMIV